MIPEQTEGGFSEVAGPKGERIRVECREPAGRPDIAAGVVELLSQTTDGNVYEAITAYAKGFGFAVTYLLGAESTIIEIYEPLTLTPLVNASAGSHGSIAKLRPSAPARPSLARWLRLRAPTG
jgi:hypothetical protein